MADGIRTRDHRDHNPGLYQLSYRHRAAASYRCAVLTLGLPVFDPDAWCRARSSPTPPEVIIRAPQANRAAAPSRITVRLPSSGLVRVGHDGPGSGDGAEEHAAA